ncbi:hypothetical protein [Streptomyces sp. NPDC085540]|uniref:hypothetical protein n=1 Tax=Streptomyces sp. NPDC085540 TaxID=3365730 RepID=UPI0037D54BD8
MVDHIAVFEGAVPHVAVDPQVLRRDFEVPVDAHGAGVPRPTCSGTGGEQHAEGRGLLGSSGACGDLVVAKLRVGGEGDLDGAVEASGGAGDELACAVLVEHAPEAPLAVAVGNFRDIAEHVQQQATPLRPG